MALKPLQPHSLRLFGVCVCVCVCLCVCVCVCVSKIRSKNSPYTPKWCKVFAFEKQKTQNLQSVFLPFERGSKHDEARPFTSLNHVISGISPLTHAFTNSERSCST